MGDIQVDARRVVDELRATRPRSDWLPSAAFDSSLCPARVPVQLNEHLAWMHQNWDLRALLAPPRQPGWKGLARRLVHRAGMAVLAPYFEQLQNFVGVSVRAVDTLAKRVDELEASELRLLGVVRSDLIDFSRHATGSPDVT